MAGDSVKLELLPLKECKQRGFKGLAMQYLECMGVHELQDAKFDLSKYEQVSVPNPFKGADVIFRSTRNLEEFRLLELASGKSVYSKDLLMADESWCCIWRAWKLFPRTVSALRMMQAGSAGLRFCKAVRTAVFICRRLSKVYFLKEFNI